LSKKIGIQNQGIIVVILIIIFYLGFMIYSDIGELIQKIQNLNILYIVPIFGIFTLSLFVRSIRQKILLKQIKVEITFKKNFLLYIAGLSMTITPMGAGETIKSYFLLKSNQIPISRTIPLVLAERFHDALAIAIIILFFAVITGLNLYIIPPLVLIVIISILGIIMKNVKKFKKFKDKIFKIKFLQSLQQGSESIDNSIIEYSKPKGFLINVVLSIIAWVLEGIVIYLSFKAFGIDFKFLEIIVYGFTSVLFGAISFIPGGVGITEISFSQILSDFGVELALINVAVIFWRLSTIWYATILGIITSKFMLK
jgi:glycosyltransferase 2 family protein